MRVGDRVEIKITGEQGILQEVKKYYLLPHGVVKLDSGEELDVLVMDLRRVPVKAKKRAELIKKIKKGGELSGNAKGVGDAEPDEV